MTKMKTSKRTKKIITKKKMKDKKIKLRKKKNLHDVISRRKNKRR